MTLMTLEGPHAVAATLDTPPTEDEAPRREPLYGSTVVDQEKRDELYADARAATEAERAARAALEDAQNARRESYRALYRGVVDDTPVAEMARKIDVPESTLRTDLGDLPRERAAAERARKRQQ